MENAHLRLGRLEYHRNSAKQQTRIWLHVDRFIGENEQGHLLSAFGLDAEVGAHQVRLAGACHDRPVPAGTRLAQQQRAVESGVLARMAAAVFRIGRPRVSDNAQTCRAKSISAKCSFSLL